MTFEPEENWIGETCFKWKANDGEHYWTNEAEVIIKITAVNDAPTVKDYKLNGKLEQIIWFYPFYFTSHFEDVDNDQLNKV